MAITNPFSLEGKTVLIAGASRGIGQAIAEGAARAGAHAILASRSTGPLQQIANTLIAGGHKASVLPLDITSSDSITAAAEQAGDVDVLINVAGTNVRRQFEKYTEQQYDFLMQTNLKGIFQLTQRVGGSMIRRGKGGKVVIVGSLTSLLGLPYISIYAMTKSALAGMTRSLAAEWGKHDIQVNCIAPGFILTDLNRSMWEPENMKQWLRGAQPNPRLGTPEDIAPLAVFLSGAGSSYITGQVIAADGGYSTTANWPFQPPAEA